MIDTRFTRGLAALALASGLTLVHASEIQSTLLGPAESQFGQSLAVLGDWNGDGHDDFAVGAPRHDAGGSDAGLVRVVSGVDLSTLWEGTGFAAGQRLGTSVADAGDVNADGFADLMAGGTGDASGGVVVVYSGEWIVRNAQGQDPTSNLVLHTFFGQQAGESFGAEVLGRLNMNNDGFFDVLIGAPGHDLGGLTSVGVVRAYSGFDGSLIWEVVGDAQGASLGSSLAKIRPNNVYDSDGMQDYLVGAPGVDEVRVLSSPTGQLHATLTWSPDTCFGTAIAVIGDTTGDGRDEFAVTAPWYDTSIAALSDRITVGGVPIDPSQTRYAWDVASWELDP